MKIYETWSFKIFVKMFFIYQKVARWKLGNDTVQLVVFGK